MENAGGGGLLPQLRLDDLLAELQSRLEAVLGNQLRRDLGFVRGHIQVLTCAMIKCTDFGCDHGSDI